MISKLTRELRNEVIKAVATELYTCPSAWGFPNPHKRGLRCDWCYVDFYCLLHGEEVFDEQCRRCQREFLQLLGEVLLGDGGMCDVCVKACVMKHQALPDLAAEEEDENGSEAKEFKVEDLCDDCSQRFKGLPVEGAFDNGGEFVEFEEQIVPDFTLELPTGLGQQARRTIAQEKAARKTAWKASHPEWYEPEEEAEETIADEKQPHDFVVFEANMEKESSSNEDSPDRRSSDEEAEETIVDKRTLSDFFTFKYRQAYG